MQVDTQPAAVTAVQAAFNPSTGKSVSPTMTFNPSTGKEAAVTVTKPQAFYKRETNWKLRA